MRQIEGGLPRRRASAGSSRRSLAGRFRTRVASRSVRSARPGRAARPAWSSRRPPGSANAVTRRAAGAARRRHRGAAGRARPAMPAASGPWRRSMNGCRRNTSMPASSAASRSSTNGPHWRTIASSRPRPSFLSESGVSAGMRRSANIAASRRPGVLRPSTSQTYARTGRPEGAATARRIWQAAGSDQRSRALLP